MISLRPNNFDEFIGKKEIKENLLVYINSSLKNQTVLDHCLFYGYAGTGKTTLSLLIAKELKKNIRIVQGNTLNRPTDIINLVLTINEGDIIFIDEIHAIEPKIIELLYSIMEDYAIDISLGKDFNSKITRIKIPFFTLIGATTFLGKLPQSLEERFGITIYLEQYTNQEIHDIIVSYCKKINLSLSEDEISLLANNSKNIPRNCSRLIKRVFDYRTINKEISVAEILKKVGIIKNGIDQNDLKYLKILANSKFPIGIKTISQHLLIEQKTIEDKIEPFLINKHYLIKTNKGRVISQKGLDFLQSL